MTMTDAVTNAAAAGGARAAWPFDLRPLSELMGAEIYGLDLARPIVTSCGSGVTAAWIWRVVNFMTGLPRSVIESRMIVPWAV